MSSERLAVAEAIALTSISTYDRRSGSKHSSHGFNHKDHLYSHAMVYCIYSNKIARVILLYFRQHHPRLLHTTTGISLILLLSLHTDSVRLNPTIRAIPVSVGGQA